MGKRIFNPEQIADLLKNPNVSKCSSKSIGYAGNFKVSVIKQYYNDSLPIRYIFENAGFDLDVIGIKTPKNCLSVWKKVFKTRGYDGFATERRGKTPGGGRPRVKDLTDAQKIERLEATVAYLRAENDFLVKLRAQRKS